MADDLHAQIFGTAAPLPGLVPPAPAPNDDLHAAIFRKPRSALGEIGSQLTAGVTSELPRQAGQALQYVSEPGQPLYETGKGWAEAAEKRGALPQYQPHPAEHGAVVNALASGARMLAPSVAAPLAVGAGLAALPEAAIGGTAALGLSALAGSVPAALQQGQQTLEDLRAQGVPEEDARAAARRTAAIEGAGETLGTYAGGKLFGIGARALSKTAPAGEGALAGATAPGLIRPFVKQLGETAVTEVGTEIGQAGGQAAVERAYGGKGPSPVEAAQQVVAPTAGLTLLLAPLGLAGFVRGNRVIQKRAEELSSEKTDPAARAEAAVAIAREIHPHDPAAAVQFHANVMADIQAGTPIALGPELLGPRPAPVVAPAPPLATLAPAPPLLGPISQALNTAVAGYIGSPLGPPTSPAAVPQGQPLGPLQTTVPRGTSQISPGGQLETQTQTKTQPEPSAERPTIPTAAGQRRDANVPAPLAAEAAGRKEGEVGHAIEERQQPARGEREHQRAGEVGAPTGPSSRDRALDRAAVQGEREAQIPRVPVAAAKGPVPEVASAAVAGRQKGGGARPAGYGPSVAQAPPKARIEAATPTAHAKVAPSHHQFTKLKAPHPLSGYLGNKSAMIQEGAYDNIIPKDAKYKRIVEPFGGSGYLGNVLNQKVQAPRVLNDLDKQTAGFHEAVKKDPGAVIGHLRELHDRLETLRPRLEGIRNDGQRSRAVNDWWNEHEKEFGKSQDSAQAAAWQMVTNSGSLGVMGKDPRLWKKGAGWNLSPQWFGSTETSVWAHSGALRNAEVRNTDARSVLAEAGLGDLVPVDPPYVSDVADTGVRSYAEGGDLTTLPGAVAFIKRDVAQAVQRGAQIIYSNYARPEIIQALHSIGLRTKIIQRRSQRGTKAEVIGFNPAPASSRAEPHPAPRGDVGEKADTRGGAAAVLQERRTHDVPDRARPGAVAPPHAAPAAVDREQRAARVLGEPGRVAKAADRRADISRRKTIAQMSPEEMRRELLTDSLTGLGNRRAWDEAEKGPVLASLDMDALKFVNDTMGHASGDKMLAAMGEALNEVMPGQAFHVSGDEFLAHFEDQAQADRALGEVAALLNQATVSVRLPDGTVITKTGVGYSYGTGTNLQDAEAGLQRHKVERERAGLRTARGGEPAGVARKAAEGQPGRGREGAEEAVGPRYSRASPTDKAKESRGEPAVRAPTVHTAESLKAELREAFGAPAMARLLRSTLEIVERDDQLPSGLQHPEGTVRGVFDPSTGKSWMVASNVRKGEGKGLALHEIGTHAEMESMLGPKLWAHVLEQVEAAAKVGKTNPNASPLVAAVTAAQARLPNDTAARYVSEETIAGLVEDPANHNLPLVRRVFAAIRAWLIRQGIPLRNITAADLAQLAAAAIRRVSRGETALFAGTGKMVPAYAAEAPIFYSEMVKFLDAKAPGKAPATQWKILLDGWAKAGKFKPDEKLWSGIDEWLDLQTGPVTKDQLLAFIKSDGVRVEETTLGERRLTSDERRTMRELAEHEDNLSPYAQEEYDRLRAIDETEKVSTEPGGPAKFAQWQLPGAKEGSYREVLLRLPILKSPRLQRLREELEDLVAMPSREKTYKGEDRTAAYDRLYKEFQVAGGTAKPAEFRHGHYHEHKNILAHIRFSERRDVDNKRILFLDEIQSDFGQKTKKAKDAIKEAVDKDFQGIIDRMKQAGVLEVNCG